MIIAHQRLKCVMPVVAAMCSCSVSGSAFSRHRCIGVLSKRHRKYEECQLSAGAVFSAKRARCSARGGGRDTYSRNPSVIHGRVSPFTGAGSMLLTWEPKPSSVSTFINIVPLFQPVCFCSVRASAMHLFWRRSASDNGVTELRREIIPMAFKRQAC